MVNKNTTTTTKTKYKWIVNLNLIIDQYGVCVCADETVNSIRVFFSFFFFGSPALQLWHHIIERPTMFHLPHSMFHYQSNNHRRVQYRDLAEWDVGIQSIVFAYYIIYRIFRPHYLHMAGCEWYWNIMTFDFDNVHFEHVIHQMR